MQRLNKLIMLICAVLTSAPVFANSMAKSTSYVMKLKPTLSALQAKTTLPVVFPEEVPADPNLKHLYASFDSALIHKTAYLISIDSTADCQGAHYCNVGSLALREDGSPQIYNDLQNRPLTKVVYLHEHQKAYFTPGHALADYWPPKLEWRDSKYFYQLTWQGGNEHDLVKMAENIEAQVK